MIDIFFKKYADFSGRARRKEYWLFVLCYSIAIVVFGFVDGAAHNFIGNSKIGLLSCIFYFFMFIPSWSFCIRRLHDTGRSGWWFLIGLVPIIGSIVLLIFLCTASDNGTNKYGESPFASIVKPDRERQSQVVTKPKKTEQQLNVSPPSASAQALDNKNDEKSSKTELENDEALDEYYEIALNEFQEGKPSSKPYAKAIALSGGNPNKERATYIKLRAKEIADEATKIAKERSEYIKIRVQNLKNESIKENNNEKEISEKKYEKEEKRERLSQENEVFNSEKISVNTITENWSKSGQSKIDVFTFLKKNKSFIFHGVESYGNLLKICQGDSGSIFKSMNNAELSHRLSSSSLNLSKEAAAVFFYECLERGLDVSRFVFIKKEF